MKRLLKPAILFVLSGAFAWGSVWGLGDAYDPRDPTKGPAHPWLALGSSSLLWFFATWAGASLVQALCWNPLEHRYDRPVPRLLRIITAVSISVLVLAGVVELIYEKSVTAIWAASGFAGLGLALGMKDMLRDVLYGVLLNLEQPFRIHDKVKILGPVAKDLEGEVVDIDWRSTRLRTAEGDLVVVPNSIMGAAALLNTTKLCRPEKCELTFHIDPKAPVEWARKILLTGINSSAVVLKNPVPVVLVTTVSSWGVEFCVQFHFESSKIPSALARDQAITALMEHIRHQGLNLASQKHEILVSQEQTEKRF